MLVVEDLEWKGSYTFFLTMYCHSYRWHHFSWWVVLKTRNTKVLSHQDNDSRLSEKYKIHENIIFCCVIKKHSREGHLQHPN